MNGVLRSHELGVLICGMLTGGLLTTTAIALLKGIRT